MVAPNGPASHRVSKDHHMQTAVIVGTGPAGLAAAACLARRGWRCEVFEQRSELATAQSGRVLNASRSYPLGLNVRQGRVRQRFLGPTFYLSVQCFHTLKLAGLDTENVMSCARPRNGWYINGKPSPFLTFATPKDPVRRQFLADRAALNRELYLSASAQDYSPYGGSIHWHWGVSLQQVDFKSRVALFGAAATDGPSQEHSIAAEYDLLIGADGYHSVVRREVASVVAGMHSEVLLESCSTYKTFHELSLSPLIESAIPGIVSHSPGQYNYMFSKPGTPMITLWKQTDSTMSGMITSFGSYKAKDIAATVSTLFAEHPGLHEWTPAIIDATREEGKQRPSGFSRVTRVSQFHGPSCVLLGDAAHSVLPHLGQGFNAALESVRVFINTLDAVGLEAAPEAFTKARLADAHALQNMELRMAMIQRFGRITIRGVTREPTFTERLYSTVLLLVSGLPMMLANKVYPSAFTHKSLLASQLHSEIPYAKVAQSLHVAAGAMAVVAVAAAALVLGCLAWVL